MGKKAAKNLKEVDAAVNLNCPKPVPRKAKTCKLPTQESLATMPMKKLTMRGCPAMLQPRPVLLSAAALQSCKLRSSQTPSLPTLRVSGVRATINGEKFSLAQDHHHLRWYVQGLEQESFKDCSRRQDVQEEMPKEERRQQTPVAGAKVGWRP